MKYAVLPVLLLLAVGSADAQIRTLAKKRPSGSRLFGALLSDKDLQRELRLDKSQIKRMQEIYLQSVPAVTVVFSPWGIKQLVITEQQMRAVRDLSKKANDVKLKILTETQPGVNTPEVLRKVREAELEYQKKMLKVLTKQQWMKFEQLKGKPYKRLQRNRSKKKDDV